MEPIINIPVDRGSRDVMLHCLRLVTEIHWLVEVFPSRLLKQKTLISLGQNSIFNEFQY